MYVCVYIIINIKVYYKTFPQFKTNYSWCKVEFNQPCVGFIP